MINIIKNLVPGISTGDLSNINRTTSLDILHFYWPNYDDVSTPVMIVMT